MKPSDFKHIVKESLREAFYKKNFYVIGVTDSNGENTRAVILPEEKPNGEDYSSDELEHNVHTLKFTSHDARWKFANFNDGSIDFKNRVVWTSYNGDGPTKEQKYSVDSYLQKNGFTVRGHTNWGEKILNEGINGHKITVNYYSSILPAIISKNTIVNEKPYRISVFRKLNGEMKPEGHIDLTEQEAQQILDNNKLPDDVCVNFPKLRIVSTNGWPKLTTEETLQEPLKEELYGKRLKINYFGDEVDGVLSKNMKPDDRWPISQFPYRISWFEDAKTGEPQPQGHIELTQEEVDYILENQQFPLSVYDRIKLSTKHFMMVNPSIHESLLLLENASREIDLWLENKNVIVESMNMVVSGANYKRTDRLDELVNYLQDTVVSPVLRGMTDPAQIDFFHKNSVGFYNLLSADGSYYEMQSGNPALGIINFYPAGIPADMARRVMMGMLKQLKKLGVQWGQLKREKSGAYKVSDVIRIPITVNNSKGYEGPEELNFTNVNAYQIFHNLLQFDGEHSFEMDAKELMERIESLAHDKGWIDKNTINRTDSDWPEAERGEPQDIENPHLDIMGKIGNQLGSGGARIIGMGLDSEGIEFRLREIWKVAKWAVDHGYKTISVG